MKKNMRRTITLAASATAVTTVLGELALLAPAEATDQTRASPSACRGMEQLTVPGAEKLESACLGDLTTAGTTQTGHTDPSNDNGFGGLSVPGTVNPTGAPGIQLDGYFPDTSTFNTTHGWNHDSQFVIRLPQHWNGGLVVAGPPGIRRQYASDVIISDSVLAKGYAYASTDKGNSGPTLYKDGAKPGDAIAEWHTRVTQLTRAAKAVVAQRYHHAPRHTYIAGFSAAGYLTRWQLENRPELYDGGIAWSGVLMTPDRNLLSYLPTALAQYPQYAAGSEAAHEAILAQGFPAGSEPTWAITNRIFWDPIQRTLREELDPGDYDLDARPAGVKEAIAGISLTGRIGKPLLTLQGSLDTAVTPRDSRLYSAMIEDQGRGSMERLYEVEGGSHFEGLYGLFPGLLRPMLPCFREAFTALEQWTQDGKQPPRSHFVARDSSTDLVNSCAL
jgi:hypothetical protein